MRHKLTEQQERELLFEKGEKLLSESCRYTIDLVEKSLFRMRYDIPTVEDYQQEDNDPEEFEQNNFELWNSMEDGKNYVVVGTHGIFEKAFESESYDAAYEYFYDRVISFAENNGESLDHYISLKQIKESYAKNLI